MIFTGIFIFIILIVLKYTLFGSTQRINYTRIPNSDEIFGSSPFLTLIGDVNTGESLGSCILKIQLDKVSGSK